METKTLRHKYNSLQEFGYYLSKVFWMNLSTELTEKVIYSKDSIVRCREYADSYEFEITVNGETEYVEVDNPLRGYDFYLVTISYNYDNENTPVRIVKNYREAVNFINECVDNMAPDDCVNYDIWGQKDEKMEYLF